MTMTDYNGILMSKNNRFKRFLPGGKEGDAPLSCCDNWFLKVRENLHLGQYSLLLDLFHRSSMIEYPNRSNGPRMENKDCEVTVGISEV